MGEFLGYIDGNRIYYDPINQIYQTEDRGFLVPIEDPQLLEKLEKLKPEKNLESLIKNSINTGIIFEMKIKKRKNDGNK